jgi:hypothetical protein
LTGRQLRELCDPVLAHVATSRTAALVPLLGQVGVEVTDSALYLVGTDRYTLGVVRHAFGDDDEASTDGVAFSLTVEAAHLRTMLRTVKTATLAELTVTPDGITMRHPSSVEFRIPAVVGEVSPASVPSQERATFIDWRQVLNRAVNDGPPGRADIAVSPAYLARFRTAVRDGMPLCVRPYARILLVACAEHFLGAVCPVRISDGAPDPFAAWNTDLKVHPPLTETRAA